MANGKRGAPMGNKNAAGGARRAAKSGAKVGGLIGIGAGAMAAKSAVLFWPGIVTAKGAAAAAVGGAAVGTAGAGLGAATALAAYGGYRTYNRLTKKRK